MSSHDQRPAERGSARAPNIEMSLRGGGAGAPGAHSVRRCYPYRVIVLVGRWRPRWRGGEERWRIGDPPGRCRSETRVVAGGADIECRLSPASRSGRSRGRRSRDGVAPMTICSAHVVDTTPIEPTGKGAACRYPRCGDVDHSLRAMSESVSQVRWRCPDTGAESDNFGELVRVVRRSRGVSQTALASRLTVSQPVVSKWESGRCEPLPETVSRIAAALGVSFTMSAQRVAS